MTYIRPGFMVVIVGATLTSISSVIVALRYRTNPCCRFFFLVVDVLTQWVQILLSILSYGLSVSE